jgi:hypothetical protein
MKNTMPRYPVDATKSARVSNWFWMDAYFFGVMLLFTLACIANMVLKFTTIEYIQFAWMATLLPPALHQVYVRNRSSNGSPG